jgi:chromosome segregation ATPase
MGSDRSRLRRELAEATALLKMNWRVEGRGVVSSLSDLHSKLEAKLDILGKLEAEAEAATGQVTKLEEEKEHLKQRCDRFNDLVNKMTAMQSLFQKTIADLKQSKLTLEGEIAELQAQSKVADTKLKLQEELVKHLQTNLKDQLSQWDRDRAQFAKERLDYSSKEQKLIGKVKALEQAQASRTTDDHQLGEECRRLKDSLRDTESRLPKLREMEETLKTKDEEIEVLRRRVKRLESELELLQDDQAYRGM